MTTETEDLEEFAYLYDFYIKAEYSIDLLRLMRIKPIEKDECDAEYDRAICRFICISPYVYDVEHPKNGCKLLVAKLKSLIKELERLLEKATPEWYYVRYQYENHYERDYLNSLDRYKEKQ